MNTDLSLLSYKELQTLAVKCKIPGNIKKQLLLKILHSFKSGDNSEVARILSEIRKNRKKRTKKIKPIKTENMNLSRETPHEQSRYSENDYTSNFYPDTPNSGFSQNYNPMIMYESFVFSNGPNNYPAIPEELLRHKRELNKNIRIIKERRGERIETSSMNSSLLGQMLQAPDGVDLGLIAGSRNPETTSSSSTRTASEVVDQDMLNDVIPEPPAAINNSFMMDNILNHQSPESPSPNYIESIFRLDSIPTRDPQLHCSEWIQTTTHDIPQPVEYNIPLDSTAILPYQGSDDQNLINLDNSITPTSLMQPNIEEYNSHLFPAPVNRLGEDEIVPELQEISPYAASTSYIRQYGENSYFSTSISNITDSHFIPGFYREREEFLLPVHNIVPVEFHANQDNRIIIDDIPIMETNYVGSDGQQLQEQPREPSNTNDKSVFNSYWPCWTQTNQSTINLRTGGRSLENTLNLCTPNYVDYTKLNATCCVYSNKTPVMTLRRGFNSSLSSSSVCIDKTSGGGLLQSSSTENSPQRHNYNASNWLLYAGGSVETTTITDRKTYDPILPTSYGVVSQQQPESIF